MKLLVFLLVLCVAVIAQRRASPFGKGVFVEGHVSTRHNNGPSSMGSIPFHVPNHYRVVKRMPYKVIRIPIYENLPHFNKVQYATQKPYWPHPIAIPVPRPEAPFKQIDLAAADIQPQDPKNRIIFPTGLSQYTERPYDYGHNPLTDSAPFKGSPRINYYAPQHNNPSDMKQYKKESFKPKSQSVIYNYSKQQYPQTPVNQMPEQINTQKHHGYTPETSQQLPSQDHFVPINQNNKNNQNQFGINYERPYASASYGSKVPKPQSSKDTETSRPSIVDTNYLQYKNNNYGVSYQQPQKESIYKHGLVKPASTKATQETIVGTNTQLQYNQNQLGLSYQQSQVQSNYKQGIVSPVTTKASDIGTNTQFYYSQNQLGVSYQQPQVESSYKQEFGKSVETKASNIATNTQLQHNQNQLGVSYQQPQVESNYKQEIVSPISTKPSEVGTNTQYHYDQNQLRLSYQQPELNYKEENVSPTKTSNIGTNVQYNYDQNQLGLGYQQPQVESSYKQEIAGPVAIKPTNVGTNPQFHYVQNQLGMNYQQPQVTASYKIEEQKSAQSYINETPYKSDKSKDSFHTISSYTGNNVQIGNNQVGMVFKQPQVTAGYQIKEPQEPYNFESQYKNFAKLTVDDEIQKTQQKVYNNQQQLGATYSQHQASASYKIEEPKSQSYNIGNHETIYPQENGVTKLDGYRNIFTGKYDQPQVSASYKIEKPKGQEPYNSETVSSGFDEHIYLQQQNNQQQSWKPSITNYELSEGYKSQSPKSNDHIYYQTLPEYQTQAPIFEAYKQPKHEESKSQESSIIDYKHQSNLQGSVMEYGKQQEKDTDSSVISVTLDANHYRPNVYQQQKHFNEESSQHFNYFGQEDGLSKTSNQEVNSNVYKIEGAYNSNSVNSDGSVQNVQEFSPIVAKEVEDQVYQQQDVASYQNQGTSGIPDWGSERSTEENWKIVDPPKAETFSWKRSSYDMNAEDWLKMKEQHDVSSHMLRQGVQQADKQEEYTIDSESEDRGTRPASTMAEERMSYPVHFLVSPQKEQLKGNNINFVPQESVPTPTVR